MSIVSVKNYKDKIVIGADSQGTRGDHTKQEITKLFNYNEEYIWGTAGTASEIVSYQIFLETRKPANATIKDIRNHFIEFISWMSQIDGQMILQNDYIIIFKEKVFLITSNLFIKEIEVDEYESIGCGYEQGNIALYLGKTIEESLNAVCDLNIYCSTPLKMIEIEKTKI